MAFIKFSLLLVLTVTGAWAQSRFSPRSCLEASYNMRMVQKGPLFGLLTHEFNINKNNCIIQVVQRRYFPKEWVVDVCREPVHIKVTAATGVDVAKKDTNCLKMDNSRDSGSFCTHYFGLMDVIQDDGLIFAEGDRDNLSSDHGKTYCAYLLLRKYLNEGVVFSRFTEIPDIFIERRRERKNIPAVPAPGPRPTAEQPQGEADSSEN
jgi:hypothetical protein